MFSRNKDLVALTSLFTYPRRFPLHKKYTF